MSVRRIFATKDREAASCDLRAAKALGIPIGIVASGITVTLGALGTDGLSQPDLALALEIGVCTITGIWWLSDGSSLLGQG